MIDFSPKIFDEVFKEAMRYTSSQKQKVKGVKILGQSVTIRDGKIVEYKVNVNTAHL